MYVNLSWEFQEEIHELGMWVSLYQNPLLSNLKYLWAGPVLSGDLEQIVERVKNIVERADKIMTESGDWMANVAHKKNNKRMHEDYKDFEHAARELKEAQDRMALAYENIGQHLSRYFDVN